MTLLERRRAMMGRKAEPVQWDYILYPANGETVGQIACKVIPVTAGHKVELEYLCTNAPTPPYSNYRGYVYDARRCGGTQEGSNYFFAPYRNDGTPQSITIHPESSGNLYVACVNGKPDGFVNETNSDCFYGQYIKIRIT